jgi:hypothetical protein
MNDLLDAECVIQSLHDQKIISLSEWQHEHPNDQDYPIYFDRSEGVGIIILPIIKRSGQYYIPRSRINILSSCYRFSTDTIYSKCTIKSVTYA